MHRFTPLDKIIQRGFLNIRVLINGTGDGAGTFAIQTTKSMGAEVTGVDNVKKLGMLRSIGADHVIDYTQEDYTTNEQRYNLVADFILNSAN